jgi:ketosteroid isomerase-like protein
MAMSESANVQVVKDAYAAFQQGDIDGVLRLVVDDVDWHGVKGTEGVAPQAGARKGRAAVGEFFQQLAASTEFTRFEPREFVAQGDQVVVIGDYAATVKSTGRSVVTDWVMVFTVRDGRIARFREWTDSAQLVRAYGPGVMA